MKINSFVEQCKDEVLKLKDITLKLLDVSVIKEHNLPSNFAGFPMNYWDKLSPEGEVIQTKAIEKLEELLIKLNLLFEGKPNTVVEKFKKIKESFIQIIKHEGNTYEIPDSVEKAIEKFQSNIDELISLLDWFNNLGDKEIIIVPDTNALLTNRKIETYGQNIDGVNNWTVLITSTVLKELDELKVKANGNEFKEKVKKTIKYIKGLRNQGDALEGVKVFNNKVIFKLNAIEPNADKALPWLDFGNNDDRIIATCFEIQISKPASCVILLTADINLQTKATMAKLPFVEPVAE